MWTYVLLEKKNGKKQIVTASFTLSFDAFALAVSGKNACKPLSHTRKAIICTQQPHTHICKVIVHWDFCSGVPFLPVTHKSVEILSCMEMRNERNDSKKMNWIKMNRKEYTECGRHKPIPLPRVFFFIQNCIFYKECMKKTASTPWIRLHSPLKFVNPHLFVNCYLPFTCSWCSNRAKCQKYLNFIDLILFLSFSFFRPSSFFVS